MSSHQLPRRPYPGLRPFHKHEWAIFFGRESMVDAVEERLARRQLVVVHGSSGCGKSSLVKAGILPRLEHEHRLHGVRWRTAQMRPGTSPLWNLAEALARVELNLADHEQPALETTRAMRRYLDLGERALPKIVDKYRLAEQGNICLLLDQFEELFRYARDIGREEADTLVEVLRAFETQPPKGLYSLVTMRSDHLGDCASFSGFAELVNDTQYLLPSMDEPALIRAIREPARLFGGDVDMELTLRLVEESRRETDALPLVQHSLMRLWQQAGGGSTMGHASSDADPADGPRLSAEGYPGLQQILSEHADEVLGQLAAHSTAAEATVEHLFRALTEIDADGRGIRRPMKFSSLLELTGKTSDELEETIEAFAHPDCGFLMKSSDDDPVVDISHEALIRCWKRLNNRRIHKSSGRPMGWLQREQEDSRLWRALLVQADGDEIIGPAQVDARQEWFNALPGAAWADRYDGGWGDVRNLIYSSREARNATIRAEEAAWRRDRKIRRWLAMASLAFMFLAGVSIYFWSKASESAAAADDSARKASLAASNEKTARELAEQGQRAAEFARQESEIAKDEAENAKRSALEALERVWVYADRSAKTALEYPQQLDQILIALEFLPDSESSSSARKEFPLVPRIANKLIQRINEPALLTQVLEGHTGRVRSAAISTDGEVLASGSMDKTARLWRVRDGRLLHVLEGHRAEVNGVALSPDGKRLATSSKDRTVIVWDVASGQELQRVKGHTQAINGLAWSPDGEVIASSSQGDNVWLWNAADGSLLRTLDGHEEDTWQIAFSPDGQRLVSASSDGTARIWKVADGTLIATLSPHDEGDPLYAASWSPNGRVIATGSRSGVVHLWDAATGEELIRRENISSIVRALAFSPDSKWLAAATQDGVMRVLNVGTLKALRDTIRRHVGPVDALAWSPDGERIMAGSAHGTVYGYTIDTGTTSTRGPSEESDEVSAEHVQLAVNRAKALVPRCLSESDRANLILPRNPPEWCEQMRKPPFHPEGRIERGFELLKKAEFDQADVRFDRAVALVGAAGAASLRSDIDRRRVAVLTRESLAPFDVEWDRVVTRRRVEGLRKLVLEREQRALLFLNQTASLNPEFGPQFNAKQLAFRISAGQTALKMEDPEEAKWHFDRALKLDPGSLDLVVAARAEAALAANQFGRAALLALELLEPASWPKPPREEARSKALDVIKEAVETRALVTFKHASQLDAVAYSPDGKLAATGASDNTLRLWNAETGAEVRAIKGHSKRIARVKFSPDGTRIASSSFDSSARIWSTGTGQQLLELEGHSGDLWGLSWSPDGLSVATGGADKTVKIWNARSGDLLQTLAGHTKRVWDVVFSPDGARLASVSSDGTTRVWDTGTGFELTAFTADKDDRVYAAAWSPSGRYIATGSRMSKARIFDADTAEEIHELSHPGRVWAVSFSPDGQWLATGSTDGAARIFDVNSGEMLQVLKDNKSGPDGVAWSPDGSQLITGTNNGTARIWEWNPSFLTAATERARQMVDECLSAEERKEIGLEPSPPQWCTSLGVQAQSTD